MMIHLLQHYQNVLEQPAMESMRLTLRHLLSMTTSEFIRKPQRSVLSEPGSIAVYKPRPAAACLDHLEGRCVLRG